jgi:hypothetical protein
LHNKPLAGRDGWLYHIAKRKAGGLRHLKSWAHDQNREPIAPRHLDRIPAENSLDGFDIAARPYDPDRITEYMVQQSGHAIKEMAHQR